MQEAYYLFRLFGANNCTSGPFQILNQVVPYGPWARIGSMLYRLPFSPRFYLRVRGMDSDPRYRKLLRTEFQDYISDPVTQRKKRETVRQLCQDRRESRNRLAGKDLG